MLFDIFSSFDDRNGVTRILFIIIWITALSTTLLTNMWTHPKSTQLNAILTLPMRVANDLTRRTEGKNLGGSVNIFRSLFIILIRLNLIGLIPYVFRLTRHLAINISLSLPIWGIVILSSITYDIKSFLAHFQPIGSPALLNPFLCVIELVRTCVRPLTLAVRLTANLRTGHILIGLLGVGFTASSITIASLLTLIGLFYFIFEIAVCVIQAYIFTLLPTLYLDDHPRKNH